MTMSEMDMGAVMKTIHLKIAKRFALDTQAVTVYTQRRITRENLQPKADGITHGGRFSNTADLTMQV